MVVVGFVVGVVVEGVVATGSTSGSGVGDTSTSGSPTETQLGGEDGLVVPLLVV